MDPETYCLERVAECLEAARKAPPHLAAQLIAAAREWQVRADQARRAANPIDDASADPDSVPPEQSSGTSE